MRRHELMDLLVDVLVRQHRRIRGLVEEVRRAQRSSGRSRAVNRLLRYLSLHESAEQAVVHPAGIREVGDLAAVQDRIQEEHELAALVSRLEVCHPASIDFMIYFGLLDEALDSHLSAEERIEAPALVADLAEETLRRMVAALALVDEWDKAEPAGLRAPGGESTVGPRAAPRYDERLRLAQRAFERATVPG